MATDLSTKEIEDGIKKILFNKDASDGAKSDGSLRSKSGRPIEGKHTGSAQTDGGASSPRKQKRNRERPRNKNEKAHCSKPLLEERNVEGQKPPQGKLEPAQDRVENHQKKDSKSSREKILLEKGVVGSNQRDANVDMTDRQASAEGKKKRNRNKKKKKPQEGSEAVSAGESSVRQMPSPSPKHTSTEKSRTPTNAEEVYKQNLAGLGTRNQQHYHESESVVMGNLEKEYIYPLKKRSLKFPTARFFCRLCEYHCDSVGICERHIKDTRHQRLKTIKTTDILLKSLPPPSGVHLEAINKLVDSIYKEHALLDWQIQLRIQAFNILEKMLKKLQPDTNCSLYGSTLTGFSLTDSNINIDITMDNSPKVLLEAYQMLKDDTSGYFCDVKSDFSAKVPCVYLRLCDQDALCQIAINNSQAVKTSQLLATYAQLDPRVKPLVVLFKYWAKLCKIDNQEAGTLPAYVFSILAIYFLQQTKTPVLPVLHELVPQKDLKPGKPGNEHIYLGNVEKVRSVWKTKNTSSLGELWIQLLRFYAVQFDVGATVVCIRQSQPLARQEKKWASKKLAIEDPFARRRNVARTLSHSQVFEYINDRIRAAYRYFGIPQTKNGPIFTEIDPAKLAQKLEENMRCLGEKPTTPDLNEHRKATNVSVKTDKEKTDTSDTRTSGAREAAKTQTATDSIPNGEVTNETKSATSSNLAIAFNSLASLCKKTIATQSTDGPNATHSDIIAKSILDDLIVTASHGCSIPADQDKQLSEAGEVGANENVPETAEAVSKGANPTADTDDGVPGGNRLEKKLPEKDSVDLSASSDEDMTEDPLPGMSNMDVEDNGSDSEDDLADADVVIEEEFEEEDNEEEEEEEAESTGTHGRNANLTHTKTYKFLANTETNLLVPRVVSPERGLFDESLLQGLCMEDLNFAFDAATLADSKGPAVMCSICQREGHLKKNCPEEHLPDLEPLPKMTRDFKKMLDQVLRGVPKDFEPSHNELMMRQQVLQEQESFIRETYSDAHLSLFGSSCNGFGFRYSDLDICLTFDEHSTPEGLNCVEIIETLAKKLRKHRGLYNVFAITTAKVPIVKFKHRRSQLDGDISLYNTLAQHNTRMLRMYADVDPRVKVLGYVMKVFAKCCDICDASRGSLSSYAYVLMVLYFLQQRKPPVIPVLQELYEGKKPECIVDGWNAWFYDDFPSLPKKWEGYGKNQESVGELWVGLLRFYTEEFNFLDYTISIRCHQPITRFEKLWNGKCIAIEDPFDQSHNLGSGLSRKMNTYILKALRKGRLLFGTPFEVLPRGCATLQDYFFNADNLTEGQPPNDRGCRICGKIGHFAKECPVVQQKKEWKERDRERRRAGQEEEDARKDHNESSHHAGSKPQPIPRERGYQRSQSYGHTPPENFSPGSGPNSLPANMAYPRSSANPGSPSAMQGPQRGPYRKMPYYQQSPQYYQPLDWIPGRQGGGGAGGNQAGRGRQTQSPGRGQSRTVNNSNSNNFDITVPNERFHRSQSAEFRDHQGNAQYHQGSQNQGKKLITPNPARPVYNSQRFSNR